MGDGGGGGGVEFLRRWLGGKFSRFPLSLSLFSFFSPLPLFHSSLLSFSFLFLFNFLNFNSSPSKRHFFLIFGFWISLIFSL